MSSWWPAAGPVQAGPLLFAQGTAQRVNQGPWWGETDLRGCLFVCFLLQPISNADFIVPVEIDGTVHQVLYCSDD